MAKNTERVCYHLCAVIALLIMAGCCHVHVWLLKWVDFHTRTTFHKMPSADVFCWMNTFVTDCLICPLHCDWCEDKQILRHACFCFRVSFFWLTVQIFTSALMVYQPAYLWFPQTVSSSHSLILITSHKLHKWAQQQWKDHLSIPLSPESSLKPLHHQRVTGLNRVDTATL